MDTHPPLKLKLLNTLQESVNILGEKFSTIPYAEQGLYDRNTSNLIDKIMGEYKKTLDKLSIELSDYINFTGRYETSSMGLQKKNDQWEPITTAEDREKARYIHFKVRIERLINEDFNESSNHYQKFKGTDPHVYFNMIISLIQAFFHIFDFSKEPKSLDKYWFKHQNSLFRERESFVKSASDLIKAFKEMVADVDKLQISSIALR